MILIALAGLAVLSVPLSGGRLSRIAELRLRHLWIPVLALALQVVITSIATNGDKALHDDVHIASYVVLGSFLWVNRRLPGVPIAATGTLLNFLAVVFNGGVMPAAAAAQRLAGLKLGGGFQNSAHLAHPTLLWLGDIIPWPGPLPNVLSVGDCLIFAGVVVLLHRSCRERSPALAQERGDRSLAQSTPHDGILDAPSGIVTISATQPGDIAERHATLVAPGRADGSAGARPGRALTPPSTVGPSL